MNREEIMKFLAANKEGMRQRFTVRRIGLFGSFASGQQHPGSDIDILVDFEEPTLDNYMDLKFFLEEHTGRRIDLVLEDSLKPRLRDAILKEAAYA